MVLQFAWQSAKGGTPMLKQEINELLTRTGPGTEMGDLFRQYWIPAMLAEELPEPGSPPVRVKLLSERLIAFRDSAGNYGLIDEFCAHRGASLWFGNNELSFRSRVNGVTETFSRPTWPGGGNLRQLRRMIRRLRASGDGSEAPCRRHRSQTASSPRWPVPEPSSRRCYRSQTHSASRAC